ncbi:hypothetical protein [Chryseobacterium sp. 6424]|uniref:phage tail protein n=1 Tax=Chryseobacterium sp. 6424 TaxID=2039166 RepID=UPI0026852D81|nr:hypothetical protein [Chryseobacterium sp. 6424]
MAGTETHTLSTTEMPMHTHQLRGSTADGDTNLPTNAVSANTKALDKEYTTTTPNVSMNAQAVGISGGNQPHNNMQPYLAMKCIIALQGVYPQRP